MCKERKKEMCLWVKMDVLWRRYSVLCRMYKRGKEVVTSKGLIVITGTIKSAEGGFSNSDIAHTPFRPIKAQAGMDTALREKKS